MAGDLFAKEQRVAERAEDVLAAEKDSVPRAEMEAILDGYKKLLRQCGFRIAARPSSIASPRR